MVNEKPKKIIGTDGKAVTLLGNTNSKLSLKNKCHSKRHKKPTKRSSKNGLLIIWLCL